MPHHPQGKTIDEIMADTDPDVVDAIFRYAYREASMRVLPLIDAGIAHAIQAESPEIGRMQVKFALGLEARSMSQIAVDFGVSRACISRGAREFVEFNNLPLPACMKSEKASHTARAAREKHLHTNTQP